LRERSKGTSEELEALFLNASGILARRTEGSLSVRAVNLMLEQIGWWYDAELAESARRISPLRPHDFRHFLRLGCY